MINLTKRNLDPMKANLPANNVEQIISRILPSFGTKALDVPIFDRDKHMYLVDQFQFNSGNRTLTYLAAYDNILVEVVLGHYYGMEYVNKLRILTPDGTRFKVVATKEWGQSTRANLQEIRQAVTEELTSYIVSNPASKGISKPILRKEAEKAVTKLFSQTETFLDTFLGRQILLAYCEEYNYCPDFAQFA